jgi:glycosyltransferase involved in cell wall biosynthesis
MLRLASKGSLSTSPKTLGEMTVSMLKAEAGFQHKEIVKLIDWLRLEQQFDLISLPYTLLLGLAKPLRETLHRPIVCTLQGEDLFLEGLHEPYKSEALDLIRSNIAQVDLFLAVSEYYAEFMQRYLGIPEAKICVVPLGINLAGYDQRKRRDPSAPFTVGFFARVAPEKGLHVLSKAYQHLRNETSLSEARLEVAGYLAPEHQTYLAAVKNEMNAAGLASEFNYRGVLDREGKIAFLQNLDLLSVPATYDEPKGMFLLEAMACGVPVVQPRRGGFTEIVEKTRGGLLVEPDDPQKLAAGIRRLANDPALTQQLGENAFINVRELYSVRQMADQALAAYEYVLNEQTN